METVEKDAAPCPGFYRLKLLGSKDHNAVKSLRGQDEII